MKEYFSMPFSTPLDKPPTPSMSEQQHKDDGGDLER